MQNFNTLNLTDTPVSSRLRQGDRLLPNRGTMNVELSHFNFNDENQQQDPMDQECADPYKNQLAKSLFGSEGAVETEKILSLKTKAPAPRPDYQNNLRVLYSQNLSKKVKPPRVVSQKEEKTLDAPGLVDDFYLNTIDWSQNNILAVALQSTLYLWNADIGQPEVLFTLPDELPVTGVSWSPSASQYLAVGTDDCLVNVWDVTRGVQIRKLEGHSGRVGSVSWNGHVLSSGSFDSNIINWDVRIPNPRISTFSNHTGEVCGLKWSRDGTQLASGGNDNILNVWELGSNQNGDSVNRPMFTMEDHQAAVKAIAWCPWQSHLLATGGGTADRTIKFWNTQTGVLLDSIDTESQVCSLLWSTQRKEVISSHGFSKNQVTVWKYPTMTKVVEFTGHTSRVLHLAQSPDGSSIMSASADESLKFWRLNDASELSLIKKNSSANGLPNGGFSRGIRSSMNQIR